MPGCDLRYGGDGGRCEDLGVEFVGVADWEEGGEEASEGWDGAVC